MIAHGIVFVSAVLALGLAAWLGEPAWPRLPLHLVVAVVVAWFACRAVPVPARAAIAFSTYVIPIAVFTFRGHLGPVQWILWLGAMLGWVVAEARPGRWSSPWPWAVTLRAWALVVALGWPIIALREADFVLGLIGDLQVGVTHQGVPIRLHVMWIAVTAASTLIAILWFDGLVGRYGAFGWRAFESEVAVPLAAAAAASALVGVYQATYDAGFLNPTTFGVLGRASGTMLDANAMGIVAAMWAAGSVVLASRATTAAVRVLWTAAAIASWCAAWGTGSRTSALAGALTLATSGLWFIRIHRPRPWLVASGVVSCAVAAFLLVWSGAVGTGPLTRFQSLFQPNGSFSLGYVVNELWNRNAYGATAMALIKDYPLTGVGVGSFHALTIDYGPYYGFAWTLPPDNAQNWLRHQLAELGIVGVAGIVGWLGLFTMALLRGSRRASGGPVIGAAVLGLAGASMLGVPAQDPSVLFTAWAFAYWLLALHGRWPKTSRTPTLASAGVWALAGFFVYFTVVAAAGDLRVPRRAQRTGWSYTRGLHALDGSTPGQAFRWTQRQAVAVIPIDDPYFKLTYWIHHPDAADRPVHVRVWLDGSEVVTETLRTHHPRTIYVRMPPEPHWLLLEVAVSHTWRPPNENLSRELGVALAEWLFVDVPTPHARVIDLPVLTSSRNHEDE